MQRHLFHFLLRVICVKDHCKVDRVLRLPLFSPQTQDSAHQNSSLHLESAFYGSGRSRGAHSATTRVLETSGNFLHFPVPQEGLQPLVRKLINKVALGFGQGGTHIFPSLLA